ncbi:hypothetical protein ACFYZJ_28235 [Streptomyces sp. NPDC001848]|uniref:type I restriction enzyme subunit R domain-containing protein n=1 Tax=Streptomyces sp. NPDC001848 TaxID=3364618 RepID=UPI0036C878D5
MQRPPDPGGLRRRRGAGRQGKNRKGLWADEIGLWDRWDTTKLLIVNNMLLTGFDAPPVHTMYLDRPLKGANLMQALARVNRRFRGKEDGLLVGYAPLTQNLQKGIAEYTDADQRDRTLGQDLDRALDELRNEYDIGAARLVAGRPVPGRHAAEKSWK